MPRDSARNSSSVSRVAVIASDSVGVRRLRVLLELALRPGELHGEAHQPLLRAVVDVTFEPAQGAGLGRHRGGPALGEVVDALVQLGHAGEQRPAEARLEQSRPARCRGG